MNQDHGIIIMIAKETALSTSRPRFQLFIDAYSLLTCSKQKGLFGGPVVFQPIRAF